MMQAIELMQEQGLTVEEVDVLTGSALVGHARVASAWQIWSASM